MKEHSKDTHTHTRSPDSAISEKFPPTDFERELIFLLNVSAFPVLISGPEFVIRIIHTLQRPRTCTVNFEHKLYLIHVSYPGTSNSDPTMSLQTSRFIRPGNISQSSIVIEAFESVPTVASLFCS